MPRCGVLMLHRVNILFTVRTMTSTVSQRLLWSALATAVAPYAFYLLAAKRLRPKRLNVTFSEADLYDDLFDGELVASSA